MRDTKSNPRWSSHWCHLLVASRCATAPNGRHRRHTKPAKRSQHKLRQCSSAEGEGRISSGPPCPTGPLILAIFGEDLHLIILLGCYTLCCRSTGACCACSAMFYTLLEHAEETPIQTDHVCWAHSGDFYN